MLQEDDDNDDDDIGECDAMDDLNGDNVETGETSDTQGAGCSARTQYPYGECKDFSHIVLFNAFEIALS